MDATGELVPDPLQDEAVRRNQGKRRAFDLERKRLDPGLELLGRKFLLEMGKTESPETVHLARRLFDVLKGSPGGGGAICNFSGFGVGYPQAVRTGNAVRTGTRMN